MLSISKNYNNICKTFFSYLPSRLLVVLNALIIVPVFAHLMTTKEIGIFQLAIGILNLVCTCSTDWIAKSALRFYEKYRLCNRLNEFFSNTFFIFLIVYFVIILGYFLFANVLAAKFLITKSVLAITLLMVIPVGFRQFLYQMLRIFNRPFLYTFSIILYQISLLALFLVLTGVIPNVFAALVSMVISLIVIDIYILREINLHTKISFGFDREILLESLRYALPQIITNSSIWAILHINKYIFQYEKFFEDTATAGISYLLVTSILTPLFSTFLFAIFPSIIKAYEQKNSIKPLVTNTIRLYCIFFAPVAALFCYYAKDITTLVFGNKYPYAYIMISFLAIIFFLHELMKLLNVKYHLKNKTYIEMTVSLFAGLVCILLNIILIPQLHILGAALAMFLSMTLLFVFNLGIQFRDMDYISFKRCARTLLDVILIGVVSFMTVNLLAVPNAAYFCILKFVLFLFCSYLFSFIFAKRLLQ